MSPAGIFESPRALIDEAKECVDHIERLQVTYIGSNPIREVRYPNPESGWTVVALRLLDPVPPRLRAKASSAINHLRHALDQCLWQSIVATRGVKPAKDTYFPFCESLADLDGRLRVLRDLGLAAAVADVIRAHKPCKRGADAPDADFVLRAIGSFAATKHRDNIGINLDSNQVFCDFVRTTGLGHSRIGPWNRGKNEFELAQLAPGGNIDYKLRFSFFICLQDIDGFDDYPIIPFLGQAIKKVGALADEMEAATIGVSKQV